MNNQPIGVLDSGVGGLSIWKEIVRLLPHESTIYVADSKNCPYGNKSTDEIYRLSKRLVQFLLDQKVKLIVLACNTITVSCLDSLRKDFPMMPIIGTVPVVKTAAHKTKSGKIGILSTVLTSKSSYQQRLITEFASGCIVLNRGTNRLVPFVERGETDGKGLERILSAVLSPFKKSDVDVLALGCSHFPFLKPLMQEILGESVTILDSGQAIARQVSRVLASEHLLSVQEKPSHALYTTGDKEQFSIIANKLLEKNLTTNILVY